jgi:hypothetical protein
MINQLPPDIQNHLRSKMEIQYGVMISSEFRNLTEEWEKENKEYIYKNIHDAIKEHRIKYPKSREHYDFYGNEI